MFSRFLVSPLKTRVLTPLKSSFLRGKESFRFCSTNGSNLPVKYPLNMQLLHWTMSTGIITCFVLVEVNKRLEKKNPFKRTLMFYHKSIGLLMMATIVVRLGMRFTSKLPAEIAGVAQWQHYASNISHFALYTMMIGMPVTGIIMSYYSGYGAPFFGIWKLPGIAKDKVNRDISKKAYKIHTTMGSIFEYFVGLHIGAVGFHFIQGRNILKRMLPFMSSAMFVSYYHNNNDFKMFDE